MSAITRIISRSRLRPQLLRIVAAVFAIRALVPVGYMPATIDDGGPFVICHGTAAGALMRSLAEHQMPAVEKMHMDGGMASMSHERHHESDPDASHEAWEHCPVGANFAATTIAHDFAITLLDTGQTFDRPVRAPIVTETILSAYSARAPPHPTVRT